MPASTSSAKRPPARPSPRFTRSCDLREGCGCPVCLVRVLDGAQGKWHSSAQSNDLPVALGARARRLIASVTRPATPPPKPPVPSPPPLSACVDAYLCASTPWSG